MLVAAPSCSGVRRARPRGVLGGIVWSIGSNASTVPQRKERGRGARLRADVFGAAAASAALPAALAHCVIRYSQGARRMPPLTLASAAALTAAAAAAANPAPQRPTRRMSYLKSYAVALGSLLVSGLI